MLIDTLLSSLVTTIDLLLKRKEVVKAEDKRIIACRLVDILDALERVLDGAQAIRRGFEAYDHDGSVETLNVAVKQQNSHLLLLESKLIDFAPILEVYLQDYKNLRHFQDLIGRKKGYLRQLLLSLVETHELDKMIDNELLAASKPELIALRQKTVSEKVENNRQQLQAQNIEPKVDTMIDSIKTLIRTHISMEDFLISTKGSMFRGHR